MIVEKYPQKKVLFLNRDVDDKEKIINFAAQYNEVLNKDEVTFEARIAQIDNLDNYFGHKVLDAKGEMYHDNDANFPNIEQKADFYLGKNIKIVKILIEDIHTFIDNKTLLV